MAAYLLAFRPADDVATVVGIFEHREVENNRRQWQDGVARARDELGAERFAELVAVGASLAGLLIAAYQIGYGLAAFGIGPLQEAVGLSLAAIFGAAAVVAVVMGVLSFSVVRGRPSTN